VEREAFKRLQDGDVSYGQIGSYLIGKDVGHVFADEHCQIMSDLLNGSKESCDRLLWDALGEAVIYREPGGPEEETLNALGLGIRDGSDARA